MVCPSLVYGEGFTCLKSVFWKISLSYFRKRSLSIGARRTLPIELVVPKEPFYSRYRDTTLRYASVFFLIARGFNNAAFVIKAHKCAFFQVMWVWFLTWLRWVFFFEWRFFSRIFFRLKRYFFSYFYVCFHRFVFNVCGVVKKSFVTKKFAALL